MDKGKEQSMYREAAVKCVPLEMNNQMMKSASSACQWQLVKMKAFKLHSIYFPPHHNTHVPGRFFI